MATDITRYCSAYTLTTGFNGNFDDAAYPATNAYASNNAYASTGFSDKRNKEYATNFRGFDFSSIPDGATINSVHVYLERYVDVANGVAEWLLTMWPDATAAAALAQGAVGSIDDDVTTVNPESDGVWDWTVGSLPTAAQLKAANFGIRVTVHNNNSGTDCEYFIDTVYITVNYTAAVSVEVIPATGEITIDGYSPTITVTNNVVASPLTGEITISGFAPTVTVTNNVTVSPLTGELTITGFAPTVTVSGAANYLVTKTGYYVTYNGYLLIINSENEGDIIMVQEGIDGKYTEIELTFTTTPPTL